MNEPNLFSVFITFHCSIVLNNNNNNGQIQEKKVKFNFKNKQDDEEVIQSGILGWVWFIFMINDQSPDRFETIFQDVDQRLI